MLNGLTASRLLLPFILYFFSFLGLDASPAPLLPGSSISICLAIFPIYIAYIAFAWNHYSSCLAFFSHKPTLPRPTTNYLAMQGRPSLLAFQVRSIYTQQFRNRAWSKDFNESCAPMSMLPIQCCNHQSNKEDLNPEVPCLEDLLRHLRVLVVKQDQMQCVLQPFGQ